MASIRNTIETVVARHDPDTKLQKVLEVVTGTNTVIESLDKRVAAIEQFLEIIPGGSISPEDQTTLDNIEKREAALAQQSSDLAAQAGSINTNQP